MPKTQKDTRQYSFQEQLQRWQDQRISAMNKAILAGTAAKAEQRQPSRKFCKSK